MSTIFAVSSGVPPAAIAVMRISGALAIETATRLCGPLPPPRKAALRAVRHPESGDLLDRALVLCFPGPATATGEDLVELHLHGGRAIVAAVSAALASFPGLRAAEPGEFTRRALASGRIDLAEAEGLGDLLSAETETQRRRALAMAEGAVSRAVADFSHRLLGISAAVEAVLDFADEDDVAGADSITAIGAQVRDLADDIGRLVAQPTVDRLRDGVRVVLAGPRNAGKSTLINALAGRDVAIVSPIAGTTRDRIDVPVARDGIAYLLTDTAGLAADSDDQIELIGIDLARQAIDGADIVLWLDDQAPPASKRVIWLYPRADVRPPLTQSDRLAISAHEGFGLDALWVRIADQAWAVLPREDQLAVNMRQRGLLVDCQAALTHALTTDDLLIIAEQLRIARGAIDRITGATDVESMLDALFGRFCIGK